MSPVKKGPLVSIFNKPPKNVFRTKPKMKQSKQRAYLF